VWSGNPTASAAHLLERSPVKLLQQDDRRTVIKNCKLGILPIFLSFSLFCAAQSGKVENLPQMTDPNVSQAVRNVLQPEGHKVLLDDGSTACEIWLRQNVPARHQTAATGAIYPELGDSTLLGVISFPQASSDYRGDAIKPGTYTLRYELLPNDGNHLGVAPNRDFLLLIPAASDSNPESAYKFEELVKLSREVTGTQHPAPLAMVQAPAGDEPAVSKDNEDHWIFSSKLQAGGSSLAVALVVKGTAPQ
jgi:hypothetical protein